MAMRVHILPVVERRTMLNPRPAGGDEVSRVREKGTTDSGRASFCRREWSVQAGTHRSIVDRKKDLPISKGV
jgi:hypothetical protein